MSPSESDVVSDYPTEVVDSERLRGHRTRELERGDCAARVEKGGENRGRVRAFLVEADNSAHIVHAGRLAVVFAGSRWLMFVKVAPVNLGPPSRSPLSVRWRRRGQSSSSRRRWCRRD